MTFLTDVWFYLTVLLTGSTGLLSGVAWWKSHSVVVVKRQSEQALTDAKKQWEREKLEAEHKLLQSKHETLTAAYNKLKADGDSQKSKPAAAATATDTTLAGITKLALDTVVDRALNSRSHKE